MSVYLEDHLDGVTTPEARELLLKLAYVYAGPDPDGARAVAAIERVKREVPGPFEPAWEGEGFARGAAAALAEYRDGRKDESPAGRALRERVERDLQQIRVALVSARQGV